MCNYALGSAAACIRNCETSHFTSQGISLDQTLQPFPVNAVCLDEFHALIDYCFVGMLSASDDSDHLKRFISSV